MSDEAPAFPFYLDTENLHCWVVELPEDRVEDPLDEAWVDWSPLEPPFHEPSQPYISMRVYDERVLLHEVMHVAFKRENDTLHQWVMSKRDEDFMEQARAGEEGIVRMLTATLFAMGWRWRVRDRNEQAVERDQRRAFAGRDKVLASVERDARDLHDPGEPFHTDRFEDCEQGACGVYWRAVKAARE
jgi:hypothetical protein